MNFLMVLSVGNKMNDIPTSTLEISDNISDLLPEKPFYNIPNEIVIIGNFFVKANHTDTECIRALKLPEPELVPYECSRDSGVLSFWDDEGEDIYSFEDGQPV